MNTQQNKPKRTRLRHVQEKYASNQQLIQKVAHLSQVEYQTLLSNVGLDYLENTYPRKTVYEEYYMTHAKSTRFWNWFVAEWKVYEQRLINDYSVSDIPITASNYERRMRGIITNKHVERSFHHNYIKQ